MLSILSKVLGSPYVIPLAFIAFAGWGIKHLLELASFRRQHRRDFLELWDAGSGDDMRLEVITRHLIGEYLPAPVVRAVLDNPFPSRVLLDLATLWPQLDFDAETSRVRLRSERYWSPTFRGLMSCVWFALYGASGLATWAFAVAALRLTPSNPTAWLLGFASVACGIMAIGSVAKEHDIRQLGRLGLRTLDRLNSQLSRRVSDSSDGVRLADLTQPDLVRGGVLPSSTSRADTQPPIALAG